MRFLLLGILAVTAGCSSESFPNRQAVEGTVYIDGQPLKKGLISFIPTKETVGPKATGVVADGRYSIALEDGPCSGDFTVKIEAISPEIEAIANHDYETLRHLAGKPQPIVIAPQYNRESKLTATIRDGEVNKFDYQVEAIE